MLAGFTEAPDSCALAHFGHGRPSFYVLRGRFTIVAYIIYPRICGLSELLSLGESVFLRIVSL